MRTERILSEIFVAAAVFGLWKQKVLPVGWLVGSPLIRRRPNAQDEEAVREDNCEIQMVVCISHDGRGGIHNMIHPPYQGTSF